jgi:hypothetical protein
MVLSLIVKLLGAKLREWAAHAPGRASRAPGAVGTRFAARGACPSLEKEIDMAQQKGSSNKGGNQASSGGKKSSSPGARSGSEAQSGSDKSKGQTGSMSQSGGDKSPQKSGGSKR